MDDATGIIADGHEMVRLMAPRRVEGTFAFVSMTPLAAAPSLAKARAVFVEEEGVSLLLPCAPDAPDAMAQITLQVHSSLDGVGLTAAVSGALAEAGIPCNMIAATHHDHVFVPVARAEAALQVLMACARRASENQTDENG